MIESHFIYGYERKLVRRISKVYNILRSLVGFQSVQSEQRRLASIKNMEARLIRARELSQQQPHRPEWRREVMNLAFWTNAEDVWERFYDYHRVRQTWLEETGLGQMKLEFVPTAMAVGSLGQFQKIEFLVRAKELGLRDETQLMMLLPPNSPPRNPALFRYIRPYLEIIEDEEICQVLQPLEERLILPMEVVLPIRRGCPHEDVAGNLIEQEWASQGREAWLTLADDHREQGQKVLNDLGIPKDAWYVTLHMREKGYRDSNTTSGDIRNVDLTTYFEAIQCITDAGGWVFRVGDPVSMTPLPNLPQVIDYAHSSIRSDWMDVFLGATSRFCLATDSGYYVIPKAFGVPVLLTNCLHTLAYYALSSRDLFLPCMIKKKGVHELTWQEYFAPPISYATRNVTDFYEKGLQFRLNTPYELAEATREMLSRLQSKSPSESSPLKTKIKQAIQQVGPMHGGFEVRPLAGIASVFLEHEDLERESNCG